MARKRATKPGARERLLDVQQAVRDFQSGTPFAVLRERRRRDLAAALREERKACAERAIRYLFTDHRHLYGDYMQHQVRAAILAPKRRAK